MLKVLITGVAGFIGFHSAKRICEIGYEVVGIDTLNDYYSIKLKLDRLNELKSLRNFTFLTISITDKDSIDELFKKYKFDIIINLAAQAGVRYSITKPYKYIDANLIGFINILEACRNNPVKHLLFASSSSVYGTNTKVPFSEKDKTDQPVSLYAATKKANEMMAFSYSNLYNIPCTGLRFFTVYGPWGRPDMAYFKFTKSIFEGLPIDVYNNGILKRDFTYIDDIIDGVITLLDKPPIVTSNESESKKRSNDFYAIYNLGNNNPVTINDFVKLLELLIGRKAIINFKPMQPGDLYETYADISSLQLRTGFRPKTNIKEGLGLFVNWYKMYFNY
jgi:UDP-glucuronate 4-epimerase